MKLISMVDKILELSKYRNEDWLEDEYMEFGKIVIEYAKFISLPITLGTFVPCDKNDIPLDQFIHIVDSEMSADWKSAKQLILFEGFEICDRNEFVKCVVNKDFHFSYDREIEHGATIESLVKYNLTLIE